MSKDLALHELNQNFIPHMTYGLLSTDPGVVSKDSWVLGIWLMIIEIDNVKIKHPSYNGTIFKTAQTIFYFFLCIKSIESIKHKFPPFTIHRFQKVMQISTNHKNKTNLDKCKE